MDAGVECRSVLDEEGVELRQLLPLSSAHARGEEAELHRREQLSGAHISTCAEALMVGTLLLYKISTWRKPDLRRLEKAALVASFASLTPTLHSTYLLSTTRLGGSLDGGAGLFRTCSTICASLSTPCCLAEPRRGGRADPPVSRAAILYYKALACFFPFLKTFMVVRTIALGAKQLAPRFPRLSRLCVCRRR